MNRSHNQPKTQPEAPPKKKVPLLKGVPFRELALSWVQAAVLVAFSVAVALTTNWLRGPKHGGLPLRRKAPFDLYTDCPEILDDLPELSLKKLPIKAKGVIYVDARKGPAYCRGHVAGAWFLPMYEVEPPNKKTVAKLKKQKGRWIVIYGEQDVSGGKRLATALVNDGVRGVHLLKGGYAAWKKAGRPIEKCTIGRISAAAARRFPGPKVFVDSRSEDAFAAGHIKGAVSIPYDDLLPPDPKVLRALRGQKWKLMAVYDRAEGGGRGESQGGPKTGGGAKRATKVNRAWAVAAQLKARGFSNVKVLQGGFAQWRRIAEGETAEGANTEGQRKDGMHKDGMNGKRKQAKTKTRRSAEASDE